MRLRAWVIFMALFVHGAAAQSSIEAVIASARENCANSLFEPTALTRADYLELSHTNDAVLLIPELNEKEAWTALLLQTPNGGVLSKQWNEATQCIAFETWANRKFAERKTTEAGIFKRAARLSLESIRRSGKPIPALARAGSIADDVIPERAAPCEVGGFVFEIGNPRRIFANAGGFCIEIGESGLFQIVKRGFLAPLQPPSLSWPVNDSWKNMAEASPNKMKLSVTEADPARVSFSVHYQFEGVAVEETYLLTPQQLKVTSSVSFDGSHLRLRWPNATNTNVIVEKPAEVIPRLSEDDWLEADVLGRTVTFTVVPK